MLRGKDLLNNALKVLESKNSSAQTPLSKDVRDYILLVEWYDHGTKQ